MISSLVPTEVWEGLSLAFRYIYLFLPIWLPAAFLVAAFNAWIKYKRAQFWQKEDSVLLEIKLPKEIAKSPAAMEVVLGAFHQPGGEGTWIDRIWKGQTRPWSSLEIVSTEGKIRFFIWIRPKLRKIIETQIYSQFPNVEIYEAEDYTKSFYYNPDLNNIWGCEFALTKADPYPIKTYLDYDLKSGDPAKSEEFPNGRIDPMTPMIEFLGSVNGGHHIWIQIIIRAHKKRRLWDVFGEKEDSWKDQAKKEIDDIKAKFKETPATKVDTDMLVALDRSVSKFPFDCGIRAVYIANKDEFNSGFAGGITGGFKQYNSVNLNGFKPTGWFTIFDYPWHEWGNPKEKLKPLILEEYKLRRFFYSPLRGRTNWGSDIYSKPFVLNTEELATIYHFPGSLAQTPTLERVPSKKSEAPPNLPV